MTDTHSSSNEADSSKAMVQPGTTLTVCVGGKARVKINGVGDALTAEVVGYHPYDFIILKVPNIASLKRQYVKGNGLTVHYFGDGEIFAFKSEILSAVTAPAVLIFIAYPSSLVRQMLRQHIRVDCTITTMLQTKVGEVEATLTDLSLGGCQADVDLGNTEFRSKAAEGDILLFELALGDDSFMVSGTIRRMESLFAEKVIRLGVQYNLHEDAELQLKKFIGKLME